MNNVNVDRNENLGYITQQITGKSFTAKNNFPCEIENEEEFSYDIKVGEKFRVESYENGQYRLTNLSLGDSGAWFEVSSKELYNIINGKEI